MGGKMDGKTKIAVAGCSGKMGRAVLKVAFNTPDIEVVGAFECVGHQDIGKDVGALVGVGEKKIKVTDRCLSSIQTADCLIDFTSPSSTAQNVQDAVSLRIAMVIGTTGLQEHQMQEIISASSKIPIVLSPNMSVGVNLLFKITGDVAKKLLKYDVEIIEVHHNMKKDAPSGTALRIAENIAKARQQKLEKDVIYGRKGAMGERPEMQIGIHSVRAGDVIGEHTVIFAGPGERLEFIHKAHSRDTFAAGAIYAAKFIITQKPGIYEMSDVLGT